MSRGVRLDLGGTAPSGRGATLLRLAQLSDLHVMDAASPARAEWVELLASDPRWRPLLHLHRPYETLVPWAVAAHVDAIRTSPIAPWSREPYDLVIVTGDSIDNAQRNELDAYLAIVAGGTTSLSPIGSAQDASRADDPATWPYWNPDPKTANEWRERGYPAIERFLARVAAPVRSRGLGVPWTALPGNHDLLRQGTAISTPELEALAVGYRKSLRRPSGFEPDDPLTAFLEVPHRFSDGETYGIAPEPGRRAIDVDEWIAAHRERGVLGYDSASSRGSGGDTYVDTECARVVLLDTNHPAGDYQGSIGQAQLAWLDEVLSDVDRESGRIAVLASHHGSVSLVNTRACVDERRLAGPMLEVVHRHPCVVAWIAGHGHAHRIEPRPGHGGGFWEITTASVIDWPSQGRAIEVVRSADGSLAVVSTTLDHHEDAAHELASLHRALCRRFLGDRAAAVMEGRPLDRDVVLALHR